MMVEKLQLNLTLYIASADAESTQLIEHVQAVLKEHFGANARLEVINVVSAPEKAAANNIFATPMLQRELPLPVVKALGDIANAKKIIGILTKIDHTTSVVII